MPPTSFSLQPGNSISSPPQSAITMEHAMTAAIAQAANRSMNSAADLLKASSSITDACRRLGLIF